MCPPDYFDIDYSINPWMDVKNKATAEKGKQWQGLKDKFTELGVQVELIEPQKGWPDMVYVDVGVLCGDIFIPSNFRYPERQGEKKYYIDWFKKEGYKIVEIPEAYYFEGHGDTLWAGQKLFCGYGFRTSVEAHWKISDVLKKTDDKIQLIPVELTDSRFYHLDTCFCPLDDKKAFYFPNAFSDKAKALLKENIELIPIDESDAIKFACNSVVIGKDIIMPAGAKKISEILTSLGYNVHQVEMSDFIKGGGACKCLSMPIE